jgi:hypothetical protein
MSSSRRALLCLAMASLALVLAVAGGACESPSVTSDSCNGSCPGSTQCSTVCPCDAADCPGFACVNISEGGAYFLPDGAPISSCSNP